jgi:hypothetical protein
MSEYDGCVVSAAWSNADFLALTPAPQVCRVVMDPSSCHEFSFSGWGRWVKAGYGYFEAFIWGQSPSRNLSRWFGEVQGPAALL